MPAMEQFTSTGTTEQLVSPTPQEAQAEFSKPSESKSHDLPGLRPLDSDLIKQEHHEKKPDLSVKPPPVQIGTQSPFPTQADISPPPAFDSTPSPVLPETPPISPPAELSAPAVPPPAPAVPPPAPAVPPPAPPPAPAAPLPSPSSTQMDFSNQMFPSAEPNVPMVPMPPPQLFAPSLIPLTSLPLPMFLPGK